MKLNHSQYKAVCHTTGPMAVIAGPGSGKTAVIASRVKRLIDTHHVSPDSILTVTFTKAAAEEMRERFTVLSDHSTSIPEFATFHSVFFRILKSASPSLPEIITPEIKYNLIRSELNRFSIPPDETEEMIKSIIRDISESKRTPGFQASSEISLSVMHSYKKLVRDHNYIDYDDILTSTCKQLSEDERLLSVWQNRYRFLLIDEFQDINMIQYNIVKLLTATHGNIFVVGDDDQSIYGFRGSDPNIFRKFSEDYPDAQTIVLDTNYRCAPSIIKAADLLVSHNKNRIKKKTASANIRSSDIFTVNRYKDQSEQYDMIRKKILEYKESGLSFSDMAILTRNNYYAHVIQNHMLASKIPILSRDKVQISGNHFIITDVLSYFRISCLKGNISDYIRIINKPQRYISRYALNASDETEQLKHIRNYYKANEEILQKIRELEYHLSFLSGLSSSLAVEYTLNGIGYKKYIEDYLTKNPDERKEVELYIKALKMAADFFPDKLILSEYADTHNLLLSHFKDNRIHETTADEGVHIMSMHSSKGLEFDTVFLPDINKSIIPSGKARNTFDTEEERRLLYVAMTRAKNRLHLSFVEHVHQKKTAPSVFLEEISHAYCTNNQIMP